MLAPSVVFVDLETTGANPATDRIIEIGIVKITEGRLDWEWQSFVNPCAPIPAMIQGFTGITHEMVKDAPLFETLADEIFSRLDGSLFIAHNARFDYSFLRNEFKRIDIDFQPKVLCTVKFSRALYPQHHKHGLDAIIARHNIVCDARHRALGDARVLWEFVQQVYAEHSTETIQAAMSRAHRSAAFPLHIADWNIDTLPEGPGVYLFYGADNHPIYIGKSTNIRARVPAHFSSDKKSGRAMRMARDLRRIDHIETAGELGAWLTESRLVKIHKPVHNRNLSQQDESFSFQLNEDAADAKPALSLIHIHQTGPKDVATLYGTFRSKRDALKTLRELAAAHQLCHRRIGLEQGDGACFAYQSRQCRGTCIAKESSAHHDLRLKTAIAVLKLKPWPFPGCIAVREQNPISGRIQWHVLDSWCHLATIQDPTELSAVIRSDEHVHFDLDIYRILTRYFSKHRDPANISPISNPSL